MPAGKQASAPALVAMAPAEGKGNSKKKLAALANLPVKPAPNQPAANKSPAAVKPPPAAKPGKGGKGGKGKGKAKDVNRPAAPINGWDLDASPVKR